MHINLFVIFLGFSIITIIKEVFMSSVGLTKDLEPMHDFYSIKVILKSNVSVIFQ